MRTDHVLAFVDIRTTRAGNEEFCSAFFRGRDVGIDIALRDHGILEVYVQQITRKAGHSGFTPKALEQGC